MRKPPVLRQVDRTWVEYRGRRLSYFGGSDYLRLSWHPAVRAAWAQGVEDYGTSVGASRTTTGNAAVYVELERALARFFAVESATLTSSGYLAPMAAAQAIGADHSQVLLDERAHACLVDAAALTGLPVGRFPHRDPSGLRQALRGCGRRARVLVMTDGLFNPEGELAPLAEYLGLIRESDTVLVDDAHGVGVLGARGRGTTEWTGVGTQRLVLTGTLSKAFGSYGGIILGSRMLQEKVRMRGHIYTGNTPVPPSCAQAALAAVRVLRAEGVERRARLANNVRRVREAIRAGGGRVADGPGPVIGVVPQRRGGDARLQRALLAHEVYPLPISYPNGPAPSYFRFAISSEHATEQLSALAEALYGFYRRS